MATLGEFCTTISETLQVPLDEVKDIVRWQRQSGLQPATMRGRGSEISAAEGARLLACVMVARIEGPATRAPALTADIARLTRLRHGALLYFDADFVLPDDFAGAVGEILTALADPARRNRVVEWIGRIGLALGAGRMAGWIESRNSIADQWEDFDYAATAEDMIAIIENASMVRRVEVKTSALMKIAEALVRRASSDVPRAKA
jgi:hypothetical protein